MVDLVLRQAYERMRWNKIGYTLVELLVVMSIILVLSSLGVFAYHRCLVYARETVCETNLNALEKAVDLYSTENDALPASLGRLKKEHLEKGYAKAMEDGRWLKKFCFFLVKLDTPKQAYAQFLTYENLQRYGASEGIFHCPSDANGGASYGINAALVGKKWSDVDADDMVIADCDSYVFTTLDQLEKRHNHKALGITKRGIIVKVGDEIAEALANNNDDITICHKPGTPAEQTKTVSKSALPGHLGHGDYIGACDGSGQDDGKKDKEDKKDKKDK